VEADGLDWLHPVLDHQLELTRVRPVREGPHVRAEDNFDAHPHRLLKDLPVAGDDAAAQVSVFLRRLRDID